jgi:hypothetical protein
LLGLRRGGNSNTGNWPCPWSRAPAMKVAVVSAVAFVAVVAAAGCCCCCACGARDYAAAAQMLFMLAAGGRHTFDFGSALRLSSNAASTARSSLQMCSIVPVTYGGIPGPELGPTRVFKRSLHFITEAVARANECAPPLERTAIP